MFSSEIKPKILVSKEKSLVSHIKTAVIKITIKNKFSLSFQTPLQ